MRRQTTAGWFFHDIKHRGITAWITSALLVGFYIVLYFTDALEPVSRGIAHAVYPVFSFFGIDRGTWVGTVGSKWTLYGLLYTIAIVSGGIYMWRKYGHNRYQVLRIGVIVVVQVSFAFSIPIILKFLKQPDYYFSYIWPLKIDYLYPWAISSHPVPFILYSFFAAAILAPVLGVFFGKRWYCGWVCGCGGLANTFGEPWRHLSQKSHAAWRFEKWSIHTVLVLAIVTTVMSLVSMSIGREQSPELFQAGVTFRTYYGFAVTSVLAGVVGTGFYPIGGSRIWCRYFCPMAAMLGLVQKFGRFRIRVKEDMCISCGLCSTYCEMGIDVRAYAQANTSFTRASCVGCGMCAEVCPRGVLRLENIQRHDPQEVGFADGHAIELWKGSQSNTQVRY